MEFHFQPFIIPAVSMSLLVQEPKGSARKVTPFELVDFFFLWGDFWIGCLAVKRPKRAGEGEKAKRKSARRQCSRQE